MYSLHPGKTSLPCRLCLLYLPADPAHLADPEGLSRPYLRLPDQDIPMSDHHLPIYTTYHPRSSAVEQQHPRPVLPVDPEGRFHPVGLVVLSLPEDLADQFHPEAPEDLSHPVVLEDLSLLADPVGLQHHPHLRPLSCCRPRQ